MRRIRRVLLWILAAGGAAFILVAAYIRLAGDDPKIWHIDPSTVSEHGASNDFIVTPTGEGGDIASPVYAMPRAALMDRVREIALAAPRTVLLGERDGYATFIQRSKFMAYPDYISVKAVEVEGGAALHVYSRARYGKLDFDVNRMRVLAWLDKI